MFVLESCNKERNKKEMPNKKENNMLIEILVCVFDFFDIGSIKTEEIIHTIKAHKMGLIPINSPINAPAKAACAIAMPINAIFNNNIQTPMIPQDIPQNTDINNALLKN